MAAGGFFEMASPVLAFWRGRRQLGRMVRGIRALFQRSPVVAPSDDNVSGCHVADSIEDPADGDQSVFRDSYAPECSGRQSGAERGPVPPGPDSNTVDSDQTRVGETAHDIAEWIISLDGRSAEHSRGATGNSRDFPKGTVRRGRRQNP